MKILKTLGWSSALCLSACMLQAQETNEVEQLRRQLQQMQQQFERVQQEQRRQIETLMQQIETLQQKQTVADGEQEKLRKQLEQPMADAASDSRSPEKRGWQPTDPIRFGSAQAYLNLSFDGLFAVGASTADDIDELQTGGHDPKQRGFTVQNLETTFEGIVDPYLRGQANIIFQVDNDGETLVEAEEAFLETMSLPWNLQLKAGHYLTEFGRLNNVHPHGWDFVDQPLVNGRLLGPDGLRNPGARVSWLAPTPFYSELLLGVQNSHGATASSFRSSGHAHGDEEEEEELPLGFRHADNDRGLQGIEDLLFAPRYAMSFDVTDTHTALVGVSALFGPNSSGQMGDTDTQIYGVDFTWKWKSANQQKGFPFVAFQTEAMLRKYKLGAFDWSEEGDADGDGIADEGSLSDAFGAPAFLREETITDYGFYSQLSYGFKPGWVAGIRFDYLVGDDGDYEDTGLLIADGAGGGTPVGRDPLRLDRWRLSPNLTWFPSEFSKLRLQYNYDDRQGIGVDHSVWLQFEFLLGSHAAHKF